MSTITVYFSHSFPLILTCLPSVTVIDILAACIPLKLTFRYLIPEQFHSSCYAVIDWILYLNFLVKRKGGAGKRNIRPPSTSTNVSQYKELLFGR